ncbi:hypothetical protein [Paenibacillus sp. HW567]|uniref:hypothetical protein n=1 Tax=Paenibacillus sp. HW567 TaxID=1034769 RepID=UPI00037754F3|nr:hypothetical protein [Paenibacillus sp. HW567]
MQAINGATPDPARFLKNLRLLVSLMVTAFFQVFSSFLAGGISSILLLFTTNSIFWGEHADTYTFTELLWIGGDFLFAGGAFALPWFGFWWMLHGLAEDKRIRLFPLHVLFAYVPLVVMFLQVDPQYNPNAMIVGSAGESTLFVCMTMAAVLLYPFYSVGIYYFVLRPTAHPRKRYRFILLCMLFAVIAITLLPFLWHLAPRIYPGILEFPS